MCNRVASSLINPIHRHPLLLMTHLIQGLHDLTERFIKIFVDNNHIKVFLVFSLHKATLLYCGNEIVILWIIIIIGRCVKQGLCVQAEIEQGY